MSEVKTVHEDVAPEGDQATTESVTEQVTEPPTAATAKTAAKAATKTEGKNDQRATAPKAAKAKAAKPTKVTLAALKPEEARGKGSHTDNARKPALKTKLYEETLSKLQVELVKLQEWIKFKKLKVVVVFEGRDEAGKGGTIKRITESLSPRVTRVAALPAPTDREQSQWYFQRYVQHLPAGGEMVLFDRSWYNRAGVERVMGFCTEDDYREFLRTCPEFERMLVRSGIILIKYWFSVSNEEQERRFQKRIFHPEKHWKLSPMDLESRARWDDYLSLIHI